MFRALGFLVWTACAVGFGFWLGSPRGTGSATLQHVSRAWEDHLEDAKDALASARDHQVRERHTDKDRQAINKLIEKH